MVVKLTQKQAEFLKTFVNNDRALYYISRWGWGSFLKDGTGHEYKSFEEAPFNIDEKEKMVDAVINGYEVIVPKFKFHNFSDKSGFTRLYYAGNCVELTANYDEAREIEKDSEEYVALKELGFYSEEVW